MAAISNFKNPLATAFGMALKRQRMASDLSSDEVADAIGIGRSYYRLLESGTNNLHVSKIVRLVDAFSGKFSFDGISKMIVAISLMEVTANKMIQDAPASEVDSLRAKGLTIGANELIKYDQRLNMLLSQFLELDFFEATLLKTQEDIEDLLKSSGIVSSVNSFLVNYDDFIKPFDVRHTEYVQQFLYDIPTFYLEMLNSNKEQLMKMPIRINFSDLWRWEDQQQNAFTNMMTVVVDPNFIIGWENLRKYKYRHLWSENYEEALFLCNTKHMSSEAMKKKFLDNLRKSLQESDNRADQNRLEKFDSIVDKVVFRPYDFNDQSDVHISEMIFQMLSSQRLTEELGSDKFNETNEPGAMWIHGMKDYSVGFFALCDKQKKGLVEGIGLTLNEVAKNSGIFKEVWGLTANRQKS